MGGHEWELKITLSLLQLNCNSCSTTGTAQALCNLSHAQSGLGIHSDFKLKLAYALLLSVSQERSFSPFLILKI